MRPFGAEYKDRNMQKYGVAFCVLWCETWSVRLKVQHWLREFSNRVQRKILGLKKEELAGDWRQLQNEEVH